MPGQFSKEELAIIEATRKEGEELARRQGNRHGTNPAGALMKSALYYLAALLLLAAIFSLVYVLGERIA